MLRLVASWREMRRPLAALEVFDHDELVAVLPGELVLQLVVHHLQAAALTARVRDAVGQAAEEIALPEPAPRKPLKGLNGRKLRGRPV